MKSKFGLAHVVGVIMMLFFIKIAIADPIRDKADKKQNTHSEEIKVATIQFQ